MAVWKVLLIGVLACACLALTFATVAIPIAHTGGDRWLWLGGLLAGTVVTGTLLALFLRHAGGSLDVPPRWAKR
jgi:Na+/H+-translocating membrane pyrophosphatase